MPKAKRTSASAARATAATVASIRVKLSRPAAESTRTRTRGTGRSPGARIATTTINAAGGRLPVKIASHSWSCTRVSVARKTPEAAQRSRNAMPSLLVDRSSDDREEGFFEGDGADRRGQLVAEGKVHDFVAPLGTRAHGAGRPLLHGPSEE